MEVNNIGGWRLHKIRGNLQSPADLVKFTEEILIGEPHILCSDFQTCKHFPFYFSYAILSGRWGRSWTLDSHDSIKSIKI